MTHEIGKKPKGGIVEFFGSVFGSTKPEQGKTLASLSGQGTIDFSSQKPQQFQQKLDLVHFQYSVADQLPKSEYKQVKRAYISNESAGKPYRIMAIPEALEKNGFDVKKGAETISEKDIKKHPLLQLGAEGSKVTDEFLAAFEVGDEKPQDLLEAPNIITEITESSLMLLQRGVSTSKTGEVMKVIDFIVVISEGSQIRNPLKPPQQRPDNILAFPAIPQLEEKQAA